MRVLQLHCSYRIQAGEDSVVRSEAAMLERAGHEVVRLNPENPAGTRASLSALSRSLYNTSMARRVRDLVDEHRPDVAHVHNTWFSASAAVHDALSDAGVPIVMTVHNYRLACISADLFRDGDVCTACVGTSPLAGVRHRCYRDSLPLSALAAAEIAVHRRRGTVAHNVTRFIAMTDFLRDRLVEIGLPGDRIVVKPHAVVDPGPRAAPPSASRDIVFVGRLAPGKGLDLLLDAWTIASQATSHELRLVIVGDGPDRERLGARIATERIERVELVGWQAHPDVLDRLRSARAMAFTSEWFEPFGMVLVEAMGAGLPVAATDVAGVRGILEPPRDLLAPPSRADHLAAALVRLTDDDVVDAEGARVRQRYETEFTDTVDLPRLLAVYQDAIGHPVAGRRSRARSGR